MQLPLPAAVGAHGVDGAPADERHLPSVGRPGGVAAGYEPPCRLPSRSLRRCRLLDEGDALCCCGRCESVVGHTSALCSAAGSAGRSGSRRRRHARRCHLRWRASCSRGCRRHGPTRVRTGTLIGAEPRPCTHAPRPNSDLILHRCEGVGGQDPAGQEGRGEAETGSRTFETIAPACLMQRPGSKPPSSRIGRRCVCGSSVALELQRVLDKCAAQRAPRRSAAGSRPMRDRARRQSASEQLHWLLGPGPALVAGEAQEVDRPGRRRLARRPFH